jgi:hypothetical protein
MGWANLALKYLMSVATQEAVNPAGIGDAAVAKSKRVTDI